MLACLQRYFRDPFSGLTHLLGALLGVLGLVYMVSLAIANASPLQVVAVSVFGVSLILLYLTSALYHLPHVSDEQELILRQLDHSMIFVFIAGTYTPFCMLALKGWLGYTILAAVWFITIGGIALKIYWIHAPRWLSLGLYLSMGWLVVLAIVPLGKAIGTESLAYLAAGGLCYTLGAIVYAVERPDPFPPHFGFHEIWHLCVLAASAFQFASVVLILK
ncbi:MAG: hemolysin III family protein [Deltaproteobacteria bacterium]|nr:hemolysin III family protein [Deltaproteobacteria bacterium]